MTQMTNVFYFRGHTNTQPVQMTRREDLTRGNSSFALSPCTLAIVSQALTSPNWLTGVPVGSACDGPPAVHRQRHPHRALQSLRTVMRSGRIPHLVFYVQYLPLIWPDGTHYSKWEVEKEGWHGQTENLTTHLEQIKSLDWDDTLSMQA